MSLELANELWLGHNPNGLLGQFATTGGYTALIEAANAKDYPTLHQFFTDGVSGDVDQVRAELKALAAVATKDVSSCARAMRDLAEGQQMIIVTNGGN
jgi:hypothetical protein